MGLEKINKHISDIGLKNPIRKFHHPMTLWHVNCLLHNRELFGMAETIHLTNQVNTGRVGLLDAGSTHLRNWELYIHLLLIKRVMMWCLAYPLRLGPWHDFAEEVVWLVGLLERVSSHFRYVGPSNPHHFHSLLLLQTRILLRNVGRHARPKLDVARTWNTILMMRLAICVARHGSNSALGARIMQTMAGPPILETVVKTFSIIRIYI